MNQLLKTNDLALTATLLCHGFSIIDIDKSNPRRAVFLFEDNIKTRDLVKKYWKHKLQIDPIIFFNALKEAKSRIYENDQTRRKILDT